TCSGTSGTFQFYNLTADSNATKITYVCGDITVSNTLLIDTSQTLNGGTSTITLSASGTPITRSGSFDEGTSTVKYTSATGITALASATMTAGNSFYNVTIQSDDTSDSFLAGVDFDIDGALTVTTGTFQVDSAVNITSISVASGGALSLNGKNVTVSGDFTGAGTVYCGAGNNTCSTGTVTINESANFGGGTYTFYAVDLTKGSASATYTVQGSGSFTFKSQLTLGTNETLNAGAATFYLDKSGAGTSRPFVISSGASLAEDTSTFVYRGAGNTDVATDTYYHLEVKPGANSAQHDFMSGTLTVLGNLTLGNGTNTSVTVSASANSTTVDVNGNLTINAETTFSAYGTATGTTVGGNMTSTGQLTHNNGTVIFDASDTDNTIAEGDGSFYNLIFNNASGRWKITSNGISVSNDLTLTAGALSLNGKNLNVSGGDLTGAGTIYCGDGDNTCSAGALSLYGTGSLGGGTYTFYTVFVGDGAATATTTAAGDFTAANKLHILASHTFNASSYTVTLTNGTDASTPLVIAGTFTPQTGTIIYNVATGNTINVTGTTYNALRLRTSDAVSPTFKLAGNITVSSSSSTALDIWGGEVLSSPTLDTDSVNNRSITVTGGVRIGVNFSGVSGSITANGSTISVSGDFNLQNGIFTQGSSAMTVSGDFTLDGTFTKDTGSVTLDGDTVLWTDTNGTTQDVGTMTITGTVTTASNVKASDITVSGGSLTVGTDDVVTTDTLTISGGTFAMSNSGATLKISDSGSISMSSGTWSASDVATAPSLTSADTDGSPTYLGVSLTGGTLNVAELTVDYLKSTGFVIGSGVTLTALDKVTWGSSGTWNGEAASGEKLLDITGQTQNLSSHAFPTTWSNNTSADCNVRSNTSGVVSVWDWSGAFGGEEYDCDTSGGEVRWKGGPGGAPGSGTGQYPAIY
ncbi:MAG: hypothetical protein COV75_03315, partial [Candidatus Omnitrophica bacterium CG11_big_fil_rev_8_21_14_0_20_63_9]